MSHIILHSKNFWFIHNPKVGGSTLRTQIAKLDETGKKFFHHEVDHPVLGPIFMGHLPPAVMRAHFSEDFEKIRDYATFSLIRDPMDRFRSAYAQRARQFMDTRLPQQTAAQRQNGIDDVLRYLDRNASLAPDICFEKSFCHFQPQVDYVELDGNRCVTHLYALDDIDTALKDIGTHIGVDLELTQKNKSFGISESHAPELHSDALKSFVEDYYARDYALYRSVTRARSTEPEKDTAAPTQTATF